MIKRTLEDRLFATLTQKRKIVTLFGPRQVGKTTLLKILAERLDGLKLVLNGDFLDDRLRLQPDRATLTDLLEPLDFLFVDEAQNIENIGTVLKLIHDEFPRVRVLATGSSSFDLARRTGEPLTGRQATFLLYPISYAELSPVVTERDVVMNHALIYGSYPETIATGSPSDKIDYLKQMVADYLLRDIFHQVDVNRTKLLDVLRLIAFQIGSEVSLNEIGRSVQMDVKTVSRYLDFLEQAFVLFRLRGFSRNLRKEVAKSQKIYFLDPGIRNAVIQDFRPISSRDDVGKLWENYLAVERIKRNANAGLHARYFFWRTYDQQEIDLIEEHDQELLAFEFTRADRPRKVPALWSRTYPESRADVITRANAHGFLWDGA